MSKQRNLYHALRTAIHAPKGQSPYLELSFATETIATPKPNEVVIRVEATPINPSDIGLLLTWATDLKNGKTTKDSDGNPVFRAPIPEKSLPLLKGRIGQLLPVGNEGAGTVISAGSDPEAQKLLGKTVAAATGGGMYSEYKVAEVSQCLELLPGTSATEGASSFVNPLTVLGMLETMKEEGFKGIIHTAAASQLGQMLVKVCKADNVPLINIVRKQDQVDVLKKIGAKYVINTSESNWVNQLVDAIAETGVYLGFDATGGGTLAGQILGAMEQAASRDSKVYSRYGSFTYKQVYVYGALDTSPIVLHKTFGLQWGLKGWLLFPFLMKIGPVRTQALRQRVAKEIKTHFATNYTAEIGLTDLFDLPLLEKIAKTSTGEKYLIKPHKTKPIPSKL